MLDTIARRTRYGLGNIARLISRPWQEQQLPPQYATSIFACGFGDSGWHHLRAALVEYDRDCSLRPEHTTLWRFLRAFTPSGISELADPGHAQPLPLFVYPWGTFRKGEIDSSKDPWQSRFCGPSTDTFIAEEFFRFIALYRELRTTGYRPTTYPHSHVGGTWLVDRSGARRFVVMQGNHRTAILAHLGYRSIAVRTLRGHLPVIREVDVDRWPLVASGMCTPEHAIAVFRLFFQQSGHHVARLLAAAPRE